MHHHNMDKNNHHEEPCKATCGSWYSWDSPIGLSIFFLALTLAAVAVIVAVKFLFM